MNGENIKEPTPKQKFDNIQRACTSLLENYLPIFLPYERLKSNNPIVQEFIKNGNILKRKTKYGEIEIRNRLLTQTHKDILEAILSNKKIAIKSEQLFVVEINSIYTLMKKLGKRYKYDYFIEKIKEIQDLSIYAKYNTKEGEIEQSFKIIEKMKIEDQFRIKKQDAIKIKIKFTKEFSAFYADNSLADYRDNIKKIATLPSAFLKSVARYMLMQKNHQINIDTFTKTLGYDELLTKNLLLKKKKEIESYKELLEDMGIEVIYSERKKSNTLKINQKNPILIQNKNKTQTIMEFPIMGN